MSGRYRVQEFAEWTGVTVRALHPYDRLGLLSPKRTGSGHRIYCQADLHRLEQIVALKFLGLPLEQIKTVLDRDPRSLPDLLRAERRPSRSGDASGGRGRTARTGRRRTRSTSGRSPTSASGTS